ncbi:MAG: GAF domain-containing protein [Chloroflexota bacterium]|nr:GAF domain-containing protein [Chloroflexota bacterium]
MVRVPRPDRNTLPSRRTLLGQVLHSPVLGVLANLPGIRHVIRRGSRPLIQRELARNASAPREAIVPPSAVDLNSTLNAIAYDVTTAFGYVGAMVATYEQGDILPVRASYVDPAIATRDQIAEYERKFSSIAGKRISLSDPDVARVYRYKDSDRSNLSIKAVETGVPAVSRDLYDLFTPIAPLAAKPLTQSIQDVLGISEVIAVPFFVERHKEVVGNLFAAKTSPFTEQDKRILAAFGRQAALAIESERRRVQAEFARNLIYDIQAHLDDEHHILQRIARGVVEELGYAGALFATIENSGQAPTQSFYIDTAIAKPADITRWEDMLSSAAGKRITFSKAVQNGSESLQRGQTQTNLLRLNARTEFDDLYSLFQTSIPDTPDNRDLLRSIQDEMGIQKLIAIPFYISSERHESGNPKLALAGNLFAMTRSREFSKGEIELLTSFSQQAAVGILNARLYRASEERRKAAQVLAQMAFTAAAAVHDLRGHLGAVKLQLDVMQQFERLNAEARANLIGTIPTVMKRLSEMSELVARFKEPWRIQKTEGVDANVCISHAIEKVETARYKITIDTQYCTPAPIINTTAAMLTEALRIVIDQSVESILRNESETHLLVIDSRLINPHAAIPTVEITIQHDHNLLESDDIYSLLQTQWGMQIDRTRYGAIWLRDFISGLGGSIEVDNRAAMGTSVKISLPCKTTTQPEGIMV